MGNALKVASVEASAMPGFATLPAAVEQTDSLEAVDAVHVMARAHPQPMTAAEAFAAATAEGLMLARKKNTSGFKCVYISCGKYVARTQR